MLTILVVEVIFIALGLAALCAFIATKSKRTMAKLTEEGMRNRRRVEAASHQLLTLKKHYIDLRERHQSTKEQLACANAKAQYVNEVIKALGDDSPVKSATTARAVLEAVVEGMSSNTPPEKLATKVIGAAFDQERGVPRKAKPAHENVAPG